MSRISCTRFCVGAVVALALSTTAGCGRAEQRDEPPAGAVAVTDVQRAAIADTLQRMIVAAYDLTQPGDKVDRLMSLYPTSGPVVSASAGTVSTSRDTLQAGIRAFWHNVGRNMREPKWTWGPMHVDVLSPDAAVLTTTYRVPHLTPLGEPHVIAGAWTAVFVRREGKWVIIQEHLSDIPTRPGA